MELFQVTLKKGVDIDAFYDDMETPGGAITIPDRKVECGERRPTSRTTGYMLTLEEAQEILLRKYFVPKREMYILSDKYLPAPQSANSRIEVSVLEKGPDGTVLSGRLSNSGLEFVDVSLQTFVDINAVLPAGVVIPPLGSIDVVFVKSPRISEGTSRLVVLAERIAED